MILANKLSWTKYLQILSYSWVIYYLLNLPRSLLILFSEASSEESSSFVVLIQGEIALWIDSKWNKLCIFGWLIYEIWWGKLKISFCYKIFSCVKSLATHKSNKTSNWRLNNSKPISLHWSLSIPPKIRKPLVFWCISGSIERG